MIGGKYGMPLEKCRFCFSTDVEKYFDFGKQPLANAYLTREQLEDLEPSYLLDVYYCHECGISQIGFTVSPEEMFSEYYYCAGAARTTFHYGIALAKKIKAVLNLKEDAFIVEVGSNDGSMMKCLRECGFTNVLGVDPAVNLSKLAEKEGLNTFNAFFNKQTAEEILRIYGSADLILCRNVFAHVPDIHSFVQGLKNLLDEKGVIMIESPYLPDMISQNAFDTIYHEHVFYLSLKPMKKIFQFYDLEITNVERNKMHGGSMIYIISHSHNGMPNEKINDILAREEKYHANMVEYHRFFQNAADIRSELKYILARLKSEGYRIAAYGAAAKGNVLLNFCGIDTELLDFVVDKNPLKQGLFTPGTHIPIFPTEKLVEEQPDYTLLLSWNYKQEIMEQETKYRAKGGKLIIPIPRVIIE
jgi:SAM-dependent methyltransferase